jgi:Spy/CpxP family protein refolding chaperone
MRSTVLALAALLTFGAVAHAQPDDPGLRARIRERIRIATEQRLIAVLSLDPNTANRLTQVLDRYDGQIAELQRQNGLNHRELKQYLDGGGADGANINRLADAILGTRERVQRLELERSREVRQVLAPQQYGRLILEYPKVVEELKKEMWKALLDKRPQKGGPAPPPPPHEQPELP